MADPKPNRAATDDIASAPVSRPACANQMLLDTSSRLEQVEGMVELHRPVGVTDAEAIEPEAASRLLRLVGERGVAVDGARLQPRGRRDQLEHRAGHIATLGRAVEQRRGLVLVEGREVAAPGGRVGQQCRVVVRAC